MFCTETVELRLKRITCLKCCYFTIDILSGLLPDKLNLLEVLLWIFFINMEVLKLLII